MTMMSTSTKTRTTRRIGISPPKTPVSSSSSSLFTFFSMLFLLLLLLLDFPCSVHAKWDIIKVELWSVDTSQALYEFVPDDFHGADMGNYQLKLTMADANTPPVSIWSRNTYYNGATWGPWSDYVVETCDKQDILFWVGDPIVSAWTTEQNLIYYSYRGRKRCTGGGWGDHFSFGIAVYDPATVLLLNPNITVPQYVLDNDVGIMRDCATRPELVARAGTQWYNRGPVGIHGVTQYHVNFVILQDWVDHPICAVATEYKDWVTNNMTCVRFADQVSGEMDQYQALCEAGYATIIVYVHDVDFDLDDDRAYWPPYCRPIEVARANMWTFTVECATSVEDSCVPLPTIDCGDANGNRIIISEDYSTESQTNNWFRNWEGSGWTDEGAAAGNGKYFGRLGGGRFEASRAVTLPAQATFMEFTMDLYFFGSYSLSSDRLKLRIGNYPLYSFPDFPAQGTSLDPPDSFTVTIGGTPGTIEIDADAAVAGFYHVKITFPEEMADPESRRMVFGFRAELSETVAERSFGIDNFQSVVVCGTVTDPPTGAPMIFPSTVPTMSAEPSGWNDTRQPSLEPVTEAPTIAPTGPPVYCDPNTTVPIVGLSGAGSSPPGDGVWPLMNNAIDWSLWDVNSATLPTTKVNMYKDYTTTKPVLSDAYIKVDCDTNTWYVLVVLQNETTPDNHYICAPTSNGDHFVKVNDQTIVDKSDESSNNFVTVNNGAGDWIAWKAKFTVSSLAYNIRMHTKTLESGECHFSATLGQHIAICTSCQTYIPPTEQPTAPPTKFPTTSPSQAPTTTQVPSYIEYHGTAPPVVPASYCENGLLIRGSSVFGGGGGGFTAPVINGVISPPDNDPMSPEWGGVDSSTFNVVDVATSTTQLGTVYFKVNCDDNTWYVRVAVSGGGQNIVRSTGQAAVSLDGRNMVDDALGGAGTLKQFSYVNVATVDVGWEASFVWSPIASEIAPTEVTVTSLIYDGSTNTASQFDSTICVCGNGEETYECPLQKVYPVYRQESNPTTTTTCKMEAEGYTCATTPT